MAYIYYIGRIYKIHKDILTIYLGCQIVDTLWLGLYGVQICSKCIGQILDQDPALAGGQHLTSHPKGHSHLKDNLSYKYNFKSCVKFHLLPTQSIISLIYL